MSIYIILLILLVTSVTLSKLIKVHPNYAYNFLFFLLTMFLCLRYGQGTDYFGYKYLYELSSSDLTWNSYLMNLLISHGEVGWQTISFVFTVLHIKFEFFIVFLSLFQMLLLSIFINKFCFENKCFALLMLYPTIYLTYLFSSLRQGLVICIFLGIMFDLLNNRKFLKYCLLCFICMTIHSSAFILIFLIFIVEIELHKIYYGLILASILGIIISTGPIKVFMAGILGFTGASSYIEVSNFYAMALILRIVMMLLALFLFDQKERYGTEKQQLILLNSFKIYLSGIMIYFMFFSMQLISSRLSIYYLVLDVVLFVNLIPKSRKYGSLVFCILVIFTITMTLKNINSSILQGGYYDNVKIWNYPYVTLFNKDRIFEYRDVRHSFLKD